MANKPHSKLFYNSSIPNDWAVIEVGEVCDKFLNGGTPSTQVEEYWNGKIPWITGADIVEQRISDVRKFISEKAVKESSTNVIPKGKLVLVTRTGVGKLAVAPFDVAISQDLTGLFLNEKLIDTEFVFYFFKGSENRLRQLNQGTSISGITRDVLKALKLPLPPLREQKAIVLILSLMDNYIVKTNLLITQKELQKKWLMQNILSGKQRLIGYDKNWKEYRIEELFEKVFRYVEWSDESLYKLVSLRRRYGGLFERGDFFGSQIEVKKIKSIGHKDFLISKRQVSHGAWGIVTPEFHDRKVSDEYDSLIVKDNEKLLIDFWDWFSKIPLLNHYAFLASNGVHIEKLIFDFDTFKRRKVLIPSTIEEQSAIAQVLQAADKEIQLLKVKTEKLREQKKGLMQVLLTGKKRLKNK